MRDRLAAILSMLARHRVAVVSGALVLLLTGSAAIAVWWTRPGITSAVVRETIEANLPMGSSVERTVMFLAAQGWLGDWPDPAHASPRPNRGVLSSDGFEQMDPNGSTLLAAIRDAYRGPIVHGGIFIKVGFDTDGRFTRYQVRDIYTGP